MSKVVDPAAEPPPPPRAYPVVHVEDSVRGLLTERELEVLIRCGKGLSNPEIAADLGLAEDTIKTYMRRIHAKLGIKNRAQVAAIAACARMVPPPAGDRITHLMPAQDRMSLARRWPGWVYQVHLVAAKGVAISTKAMCGLPRNEDLWPRGGSAAPNVAQDPCLECIEEAAASGLDVPIVSGIGAAELREAVCAARPRPQGVAA